MIILLHQNSFRIYLMVTFLVIEFLATTTVHIEVMENVWDKLNHFSAFFVLYILLHFAYKNLSIVTKAGILVAYGLQIEIVQSFIDGRYFSLLDVFADSIGILLGITATLIIKKIFNS